MEVYLSHMVIFRVVEKLRLHKILGSGWVQYCLTVGLVLVGTIAFSWSMQRAIEKVMACAKAKEAA